MPKKIISEETWAAIERDYTTTRKSVSRIAAENKVDPGSINHRVRVKLWQRPSERPEYAPNAAAIVRSVETRAKSKGGAFDIAPVDGSKRIPFHLIINQGLARQCTAILDDRPGEMDRAEACGAPTNDPACPYCADHLKLFTSPRVVTAKELTRSLRRYS